MNAGLLTKELIWKLGVADILFKASLIYIEVQGCQGYIDPISKTNKQKATKQQQLTKQNRIKNNKTRTEFESLLSLHKSQAWLCVQCNNKGR